MLGTTYLGAVVGSALARVRGVVDRDARRLRLVARDPARATHDDLELLVRSHGVPEPKVWAVTDRLGHGDLDAALVWRWTMQHDGTELADLCSSRLTHRELVDLMDASTGPASPAARVA